ncbi:MAG TPA: anti-sigma regulatory factor [Anaeromyxobacter sp.]
MMTTAHTDAAVLFLRMQPSWVVIDDIRRFVAKFCAHACPEAAREDQVALAAHELVQNAIANAATSDIEMKLELDRSRERVVVSVSNVARADQIAVLRMRLARILAHANALEGYVAAMREDPESRGGIGLARIRFEAALDIALEVDGEKVTMHAAGSLSAPDPTLLVA